MSDAVFKRGLDDEFVRRLNYLYDEDQSWWRCFVEDEGSLVAIRDNYLNVYYLGASILKLEWSSGGIVGSIHYKYVVRPSVPRKHEYLTVGPDGTIRLPTQPTTLLFDNLNVSDLKKAARAYTQAEKKGVHQIARQSRNAVLDLEVAISDGRKAQRVDIAALVDRNGAIVLRFFEVKTCADNRLNKQREDAPKVVGQIKDYSRLLCEHHDEILASYRRVCENFHQLKGLAAHPAHVRRRAMIDAIVRRSKPLELDNLPRLVVFDFDADQKRGGWVRRQQTLNSALGQDVLARGAASDVHLGRPDE